MPRARPLANILPSSIFMSPTAEEKAETRGFREEGSLYAGSRPRAPSPDMDSGHPLQAVCAVAPRGGRAGWKLGKRPRQVWGQVGSCELGL